MLFIGFDCDECLAQVEKLMPFTESGQYISNEFIDAIINFNIPFIRPSFWPVLSKILEDKSKDIGKIKTFIYSNNGSLLTLECVNAIISTKLNTESFFDAIAHYGNTNRTDNTNGQRTKKWDSMKEFLSANFNADINTNNVLFFDDLPHKPLKDVLENNYVQVQPYYVTIKNSELLNHWANSGGNSDDIDFDYESSEDDTPLKDIEIEADNFLQKVSGFLEKKQTGGKKRKRYHKSRRLRKRVCGNL